tara:strand:+ start:807 stop:1328 length:522 start_codon:yes stop_codon:yes gene_type:complete
MANIPILNKSGLLELLLKEGVSYELYKHEALYTVKDAEKNRGEMDGIHTKNIFLKNKKNEFFLFSCYDKQIIDLKRLSKSLGLGNVSFAKEDKLYDLLGVLPGSVSPFGLLNDKKNLVKFFLDKKIIDSDKVNYHPLENTSTVSLRVKDFTNFLIKRNKIIYIIDYETYSFIC